MQVHNHGTHLLCRLTDDRQHCYGSAMQAYNILAEEYSLYFSRLSGHLPLCRCQRHVCRQANFLSIIRALLPATKRGLLCSRWSVRSRRLQEVLPHHV